MLELPGADFSDYRWGATLDPPLPGLMDRPYVSRELIPAGDPASAALVRAIDRRLQEGVYEPSSLPALARLMGVGDVVLRSDLQYERFRTPQPISTWAKWTRLRPQGLGAPKTFGPPVAETPAIPFIDEISLANPARLPPSRRRWPTSPSPTRCRSCAPSAPASRCSSPADSEGLVDASAAGMLDTTGVVRFAASQTSAKAQATAGAVQRRPAADRLQPQARRALGHGPGELRLRRDRHRQAAGQGPQRRAAAGLPRETTADQTVAVLSGVADIEASNYGNEVSYSPSDRPFYAFDGDPTTAWSVGAFGDPRGAAAAGQPAQRRSPPTTVTLVQPYNAPATRYDHQGRAHLLRRRHGKSTVDVDLTRLLAAPRPGRWCASRAARSPSVEFKIVQTSNGTLPSYDGQSGVGLAELSIPGVKASEVLRLPNDLFTAAGTDGSKQALSVMLTRDRANPQEPFKTDTELSMARAVHAADRAHLRHRRHRPPVGDGQRRVARRASRPRPPTPPRHSPAAAWSPRPRPTRCPVRWTRGPRSAVDDNPKTAWTNAFGGNIGSWLQITVAAPGHPVHARPEGRSPTASTRCRPTLQLLVDGKAVRNLHLPAVTDRRRPTTPSPCRSASPRSPARPSGS